MIRIPVLLRHIHRFDYEGQELKIIKMNYIENYFFVNVIKNVNVLLKTIT